ncbi:MAG: hypothetical protein IJP02_01655 [Oscillospiraceae bacterium]|nr:hypothetical protein [Oscillospiraceae bacterium]
MTKTKKICLCGAALLMVLIAVTVSIFAKLYEEKSYWQERAAGVNYSGWDHIYFMTTQVEKIGFTKQAVEEMHLYINGILFTSEPDLQPRFGGPVTAGFLQHYYAGLALDIASGQLDDEQLQRAVQLFKDATLDLKELSRAILDLAEDRDERVQLLDEDSALYRQVQEMILNYSEEYDERFRTFYSYLNAES